MADKNSEHETLEGYIIDLACLRKYPQEEIIKRAEVHTTECALMGHCIESGYGLVNEAGHIYALDTHATPLVVSVLEKSRKLQGIRLNVQREKRQSEMHTTQVKEV